MSDADLALFELAQDVRPALPTLQQPRMGAVGTKWSRYDGTHRPCDLCTKRIHELGVSGAPAPGPARKRRVGPNDTLYLCDVDAEEMRRLDDAAEAKRKERIAANAEKPSPGRVKSTKPRQGLS